MVYDTFCFQSPATVKYENSYTKKKNSDIPCYTSGL
jgi:hypothetical protein